MKKQPVEKEGQAACPVCGRACPEYQVENESRIPLGCERCLTIRRRGVIQL